MKIAIIKFNYIFDNFLNYIFPITLCIIVLLYHSEISKYSYFLSKYFINIII